MSDTCNIVLTGEILPGHNFDDVVAALATVLKTSEARAAKCLAGKVTTIKRDVPIDAADRYLRALLGTGAQAKHIPSATPAPTPLPAVPPTPATAPTLKLEPAVNQSAEAAPSPNLAPDDVECPQCGHPQPKRTLCMKCGCDMPRVRAAQQQAQAEERAQSIYKAPGAMLEVDDDDAEDVETPKLIGLSFSGRLGRLRYIAYSWVVMAAIAIAGILAAIAIPMGMKAAWLPIIALALVGGWNGIRYTVMRLHDLNRSGKWIILLIFLSGFAGAINSGPLMLFVWAAFVLGTIALMAWPGTDGHNDYGLPCGPNSTLITVGACLLLILQVVGTFSGAGNAMRTYEDYRTKSAGLSKGSAGGKALDFAHPVYAQVQMKQHVGGRDLEMVYVGKAGSEQDCKTQGETFRSSIARGCKECAVSEPVCTKELPARYAILFENIPLEGTTYLSMSAGNNSEREGRLVYWGLSAEESSRVCGMMQGRLQSMQKGTVQCVSP